MKRLNELHRQAYTNGRLLGKGSELRERIAGLEAFRKKELDFYLLDKKRMSRRIALLGGWMEKLFNSKRQSQSINGMTTEIPEHVDTRRGVDDLNRETLEKGDE